MGMRSPKKNRKAKIDLYLKMVWIIGEGWREEWSRQAEEDNQTNISRRFGRHISQSKWRKGKIRRKFGTAYKV